MNKFQIFWALLRRTAVRVHLFICRLLYRITFGLFPKGLFSMTVDMGHINTDVKITEEDEDSVTLAKMTEGGLIKRGDFKILSTTDLHLEDNPKLRRKALQLLANHITQSKPDLVIFTGDFIQSKFQQIDAVQFAQYMEKIGVYWAIVFGNHETREEKGLYKYMLVKDMMRYKHCLVRFGKEDLFGYANYCIKILKDENTLQQALFLFDSGRDIRDEYRQEHGVPEVMNGYDFIKNNQKEWYKNKITELREKYGDFKSMCYMHIPIKEYENVIIPRQDEGKREFTDKCRVLYGAAYENIGSSPFNSGLFDLAKELGSTQAFFSGHDHINDFAAKYDGILLVYNQCCGYETYTLGEKIFDSDGNPLPEKEWPQGVTLTLIHPDGEISLAQRFNRMYLKEVIAEKKAAEAAKNKKKKR